MNLPAIKQIVIAQMANKRSSPYNELGDKYAHGQRTAALALRLRQLLYPNEKHYDDVMTVAAWFHDILNGSDDHSVHEMRGAELAMELLRDHCTMAELDEIYGIIVAHDTRKPGDNDYSNAIKLHQDADHLDHFGSMDIWRWVAYAIGHNETISEAADYRKYNWNERLARWRKELNYSLSVKIYDEKAAFARSFAQRFAVEAAGGIWNEDALLPICRGDS